MFNACCARCLPVVNIFFFLFITKILMISEDFYWEKLINICLHNCQLWKQPTYEKVAHCQAMFWHCAAVNHFHQSCCSVAFFLLAVSDFFKYILSKKNLFILQIKQNIHKLHIFRKIYFINYNKNSLIYVSIKATKLLSLKI